MMSTQLLPQSQEGGGSSIHKDSSIVFLQEQHAKTLLALHDEIQKLQQKCASEFVMGLCGLSLKLYDYRTNI